MFKLILRTFIKLILILFLVAAVLVLGNLYTYKRLVDEEPIAQLTFKPVKAQEFDAVVRLGNFCDAKVYKLYGDEWRIDAQFLKWKSWVTLFGINAMYRIDRISGRYTDIQDENFKLRSAHELKPITTLDLSKLDERYSETIDLVDTVYGSSAYEKMKDKTLYTVFRTQSGILIREQDIELATPLNTCTSDDSVWKSSIIWLDQNVASLFNSLEFLPSTTS